MNLKSIASLLSLSLDEIKNLDKETQINVLEKLVSYHNKKYFIDNNPVISDNDFDILVQMLEKLKPDSPILYEIVGEIGNVKHSHRMLSIEKKYNYDDVKKWLNDIPDDEFIVEPKYDGMAARYQNGVLATRGDGNLGENITERLKYLNIIGKIEGKDLIEGEIIIPNSFFEQNLKHTYKNSRNAVVGIIKAKIISTDGVKALLSKGVHFVVYDAALSLNVKKEDLLDEEKWQAILEKIYQTDYPLDGVVIKATNKDLRSKLGATEHHYRWQIAYKLPAEKKWSVVENIKDQVGRTGRITSVAVIKPIELSGVTVTNVTLHNIDFVEKSKIGIGSKVEVMRAGEVIPFIVNVKPAKEPYAPPTHCPVCKKPLKRSEKYLECTNKNCPARKSQSIEYFFKVLGVEELGIKTILRFMNELGLKNIIDYYNLSISENYKRQAQHTKPIAEWRASSYHLDKDKIAKLPGFGAKSAEKIIANINATLNGTISESDLLQALGIKEIGPATSKWIINQHGFNNLNKLTVEDLQNVKGIGPKKAQNFIDDIKHNWDTVEKLMKLGLNFKKEKKGNKLNGLSFCITGKKEKYSRDELIEIINTNGGVYHASVTKDLSYLIAGEDAGSKLTKANSLGVKVISESEFFKMLD